MSFTDLDFLTALDLYVEPFIETLAGSARTGERTPPWVAACYALAARTDRVITLRATSPERTAARAKWRGFLVLLTRDDVTRDAVDAVGRLGDPNAAAAFVAPLLARFSELMAAAPVCSRVAALQATRARRLDGRAARVPDASYAVETRRPPKPRTAGQVAFDAARKAARTKNRPPRA